MAADIEVGQNRSVLQGIADGQDASAGGVAATRVANGRMTKTGDASTVTFTQTIALNAAPSRVKLFPRTGEAGKPHFVPIAGLTSTQFSVTFSTAPAAGAGNIVFDYEAFV